MAILMTPPTWDVQFLNLKTKVYCVAPASTWRSPVASTASMMRPGDSSALRSVGSTMSAYNGLPCRKYILKLPTAENSSGERTWQRLLVKAGILYAIDDSYYPKSVGSVLGKTFGTLKDAGIPLVLTCQSNGNEISEELKLTAFSKVPVKISDLQVPKDFKLVKTANEVTKSEMDDEGLSEMIR
jgi:hypothetical protein